MEELIQNLGQLVNALWGVIVALGALLLPWLGLAAWVVFWTLAVNWIKLFDVIRKGGWVGLLLIGLVMLLVWGNVAPPVQGHHSLLGLTLNNFVGKTVYVTALFVIMALCGSLQLSGAVDRFLHFVEPELDDVHAHAHAHASHGHH